MLTLYYSPGACSMATHMTLEEVGAEFTPKRVMLANDEQKTEAYLRVNPRGRVPALALEDGTVLTENVAILPYLAERFPEKRLMPDDALGRAQAISLMAWFASGVHPIFTHVRRPERFVSDEAARPDVVATAMKSFWAACQEIERTLGGREHFVGDRLSVADIYSLVFYNWAYRVDLPVQELGAFTKLKDRVANRPGIRRALEREESPLLKTL